MVLFSTFLISTIITILLMPVCINIARKAKILDIPDDRKIHRGPIPRIGGISMAIGALIPIVVWTPLNDFIISIIMGSAIVVIFGLADDLKNIGFKLKFLGQIFAACIVVIYGGIKVNTLSVFAPSGFFLPVWISIPFTILIIVAVTNAINLSDGLDGLAGGITLLTLLCIGYLSYLNQFQEIKVISVALVGAIFGLLRYNTHPATVFMGDAGSQLLGFITITISLALTRKSSQISIILTLLIMGIPIIDTLSVMVQRIIKGRSPFVADKNHIHHKLMRIGLEHSESVMTIYLMHAILVGLAFIFRFKSPWFLLCFYIVYSGAIIITLSIADRTGWKIKRYSFIDNIIKGHLRALKEENIIIKIAFKVVEMGFIFLLVFTCFLPENIHIYFSISAMAYLGLILLSWKIKNEWTSVIIEISIFMMIPFLIYLSETNTHYLADTILKKAYTISFGVLMCFVFLTIKFSRRTGFKTTPTDFLIIFIALIVPYLPDQNIKSWQMSFVAAKIISLFFCYEVLKGELRSDSHKLKVTGIVALLLISIRGFVG